MIYLTENSKVQSIIFKKSEYSLEEAKDWLKKNGYKYSKVDEKESTYRFRQIDPDKFNNFRTKKTSSGISFVLGFNENKIYESAPSNTEILNNLRMAKEKILGSIETALVYSRNDEKKFNEKVEAIKEFLYETEKYIDVYVDKLKYKYRR